MVAKDLGEPSPVRAAKSDKAVVNRQRFTTVTNPDGSSRNSMSRRAKNMSTIAVIETRLSLWQSESADAIRKSATSTPKEVAEAEGEC